jgi:hypothetical protein
LWIGLEFGKRKTPVVKIASEACMGLWRLCRRLPNALIQWCHCASEIACGGRAWASWGRAGGVWLLVGFELGYVRR